MTCLSWNVRGLGNPRTVQVLRDLVNSKRPDFVFLMETLLDGKKAETVCETLRYEGCFVVQREGHSGGLMMLWKDKKWGRIIGSSCNHIDLLVTMVDNEPWRLTGFYGYPE